MRKLIAIGLALAATTSFGALGAASASAAAGEIDFACNQDTACTFHGLQKAQTKFRVNGGTVTCTNDTFLGGTTAAAGGTTVITEGGGKDWAIHTVKVVPTYSGCIFNGLAATVSTTGCFYNLTAASKTAGTETIGCEAGKNIVISVPSGPCTITIGAQTPVNNAVDYTVEEAEGKKDVLVTLTVGTEIPVKGAVSGITYTSSGGVCGESGQNGSSRGSVTLKAYKSAEIVAANQISGTLVETTGKIKEERSEVK
jgi:hypothetical protein